MVDVDDVGGRSILCSDQRPSFRTLLLPAAPPTGAPPMLLLLGHSPRYNYIQIRKVISLFLHQDKYTN